MQEEDAALEAEEREEEEREEAALLAASLSSPQDQNRCVCGRDETGTQAWEVGVGVQMPTALTPHPPLLEGNMLRNLLRNLPGSPSRPIR